MNTPPRAVLWDMDGTLALSEPLHMHTLIAALAHCGVQAGDELHPLMFGRTGLDVYRICRERFGIEVDFPAWSALRAARYVAEAPQLEARPGALEIWRAAHAVGLRQAVVSNAGRMLLEANLNALGLQAPERVSVSANDVRHGKPDPEAYLRAAYLLDVVPAEAIAIEDSPTGARAALAAGMRVLGWPDAGAQEANVSFPQGTQIVHSAREIAAALGLSGVLSFEPASELTSQTRPC
ncbi:HAD family hydrolase [Paraburkholderia silvatlantica]|uniref:HAD superfamily hydrolase (TIGR01509 family) n=1 Tax=Paraburkholderia silvatlantica TaxID=321895 RepID=A0ABR6FE64_9BURK|nr:HAD family phosphatase [Paraburkholderia silvatlantica]MBB2925721.1 HAD superfamily hydrolase (TIGR01509 family) [Paraburkholderia silvatlantica]PVY33163.1 HAD superfamily hydrolase (TIGR01509 family) [Paraburkholderia silvatlantica]PXW38055.1 HAD superfamily hydrolase (TIGR01509 family) [Paraburkholderia silvatlantica]TDQ92584.1 HAD superfamily hydrolase (TIGR01509 family) [Paraburkholderia silvatlantica]